MSRHTNRGLRKVCDCPRRTWAKCPHSWHFNFKPKGGQSYRFSVDSEAGKHIESKGDAEALAEGWRSLIRAGKFRRSHESAPASTVTSGIVTLEKFGETYTTRLGRPVSRTPESREAFRAIDLTFHDLRHEGGSRLLEAGWSLHNVSHMLGHTNIAQTSTYLNATKVGLQEAMRRLDAARAEAAGEQEREQTSLARPQDDSRVVGLVN